MLAVDARLFFNSGPSTDDRVLLPATVTAVEGKFVTVHPDHIGPKVSSGNTVEIFYERSRKFVRQDVRIEAVEQEDESTVIRFETVGDAEMVEQRQEYRVLTIMEDLDVALNTEAAKLADVSATGFSSVGRHEHRAGETLNVTVGLDRNRYTGKATVQSVKTMPNGQLRYGYIVHPSEKELLEGLRLISMDTQRKQLRRRRAA